MRNLWLIDPIMAQKRNNGNACEIVTRVWKGLVLAVRPVVSDRYNARYMIVDFCRMLLTASFLDASVGVNHQTEKYCKNMVIQRQNLPPVKRFRAVNGNIHLKGIQKEDVPDVLFIQCRMHGPHTPAKRGKWQTACHTGI